MDKDLSNYFDNYWSLFSSQGWKQFVEDIEDNRTLMSDLMTVKDEKDLFYRKGVLETLNRIVNFQVAMEAAYKEQTDEDSERL